MEIDLKKKADAFSIVLTKKGVAKAPIMRVATALDISGSMSDEIADGSLQRVLDQLGGVAINFDDNQEIDVWKFDDRSDYVGTWQTKDYGKYVKSAGIRSRGGTSYSPFIRDITSTMFPAKPKSGGLFGLFSKSDPAAANSGSNEPVLVLVITDGEPMSDKMNLIEDALANALQYPIFFAFVGVSNQSVSFPTLVRLESKFSNVGFIKLRGVVVPDNELYEQVVTDKLVGFVKGFVPQTA